MSLPTSGSGRREHIHPLPRREGDDDIIGVCRTFGSRRRVSPPLPAEQEGLEDQVEWLGAPSGCLKPMITWRRRDDRSSPGSFEQAAPLLQRRVGKFEPPERRIAKVDRPVKEGEALRDRRQTEGGASFCCMHERVQRVADARLGAAAALLASTVVPTAGGSTSMAKPLSARVLN